MNKYVLLALCLLTFNLLVLPVMAQPNYFVKLNLFNKSVDVNTPLSFEVRIEGGGSCEDSKVSIIPEGALNISSTFTMYNNDGEWKQVGITSSTYACQSINGSLMQGETPRSLLQTAGVSTLKTTSFFNTDNFSEFSLSGKAIPLATKGADYEITAVFSCLKNKSWYIFSDKNSYHVNSFMEEIEARIAIFSIIISVVALFVSISIKRRETKSGSE